MKRRKLKRCWIVMGILFIMLSMIPVNVRASEKVKLSTAKKTIPIGQTCKVKLKNNKKRVKWTVSGNKIKILKKTKTYAKIKGIKRGTAYLRAKVGRKTYKCKIVVKKKKNFSGNQNNNQSNSTQVENVSYRSQSIHNGVVIFVKNNYSYTVSVGVDCLFYDSRGTLLKMGSDYNYGLQPGWECALFVWNSDSDWTSHKINIKVENAANIITNASRIGMTYNVGNKNVMVQVRNNGIKNDFTQIAVVYYKTGYVVGYERRYAEVSNSGAVDYLEFPFHYDGNYNVIIPDTYAVYANYSYAYTW